MVTFRFYLVSVVAFFLALAVGVVVGSVLDGRIADSLQDRLDRVETSLDETVAAMDDKNREIDDLERYVEASAPYTVQGELVDTTSLVVVEPGVDGGPVEDLVTRLRQAGSRVEGIVWLESSWDLSDREQLGRLAAIAGTQESSAEAVRRSFWAALVDPRPESDPGTGAEAPADGTTTTTLEGVPIDESATTAAPTTVPTTTSEAPDEPVELFTDPLLVEAERAGLVRLQRIDGGDGVAGGELVVAVVTGTDSTFDRPGAAAIEVAEESAAADRPTVLSEVFTLPEADADRRGELTGDLLRDGPLTFSTVDDLDRVSGRVAAALAISAAREQVFGRFGYGPGADAVLPAWREP